MQIGTANSLRNYAFLGSNPRRSTRETKADC